MPQNPNDKLPASVPNHLDAEVESWCERSLTTTKASAIAAWTIIGMCVLATILALLHG